MKVRDLIFALKNIDEDYEVIVGYEGEGIYGGPLEVVQVGDDGPWVKLPEKTVVVSD